MSNEGRARENGYRAFISYSHRDDAAAKSLHKRLETYRLPKKLIGQSGECGPITERLTPIFRDLDELSAADDLTVEIKAALARSATLIVLCSPGAKASKWVNLEIETFRALHGNSRPVLAALIEGEPADAFPSALIADGQEPVAADFRKNRDGKSLALLKLVAGMAGVPLDTLVQRDAQRQYRRVMAITGTALTAALAMALLLVVALRAQSDAERQRQEAEGLVEYMLTDLRDKLKGVGRLDVMTAVNERAMKYYGGQEALEGLPAESLERRARILHAMGEDDQTRGDLKLAVGKFEEAHRATEAILAKQPNDPNAIFSHAQSEYWVGSVAYLLKDRTEAAYRFAQYRLLAKRLLEVNPQKTDWLREAGYAEGSLCSLSLDEPAHREKSIRHCGEALKYMEIVRSREPNKPQSTVDVINRLAWASDSLKLSGNYLAADKLLLKRKNMSESLINYDSNNKLYIELMILTELAIADLRILQNQKPEASKIIEKASSEIKLLIDNDKNNAEWNRWQKKINEIKSQI